MIHILHMIQRRREGRPLPWALPLALVSAAGLMLGLGLLLQR